MNKIFIAASDLLRDSFLLASRIFDSGFRPDFVIGVWRGGTPVGIAVQEYFEYRGVSTDHIAVRTSSYTGIGEQASIVRVHGLHYVLEHACAESRLLLVDDVFDSGRSFKALLDELALQLGPRLPGEIKLAAPWYKPANRKVDLLPDFYLRETGEWLVFPHELSGLSRAELLAGKTELAGLEGIFPEATA